MKNKSRCVRCGKVLTKADIERVKKMRERWFGTMDWVRKNGEWVRDSLGHTRFHRRDS